MYNAFLQRTKETIDSLGKHIKTSDFFRTAVFDGALKCSAEKPCFDVALGSTATTPDRLEWRIIDHCTAVTRIYAIYEQFVHEMMKEHITLLQSKIQFSELPESIRRSYRLGLAKILEKKDNLRFADLDLQKLIGGYERALTGKIYTLEPKAMLMQEQNLRMQELHRFLAACGIDGIEKWIEQHHAVKQFFSASTRLTGSASSELGELIKYRNDAAHGSIDIGDILHVNVLIEFCDFIDAVCEALAEKVQLAGLEALIQHRHASTRGKLNESLRGNTILIGALEGAFKVSSTVYLCGETYCLERRITSLQLEGIQFDEINLTTPTELGIMFDRPGKKNATVISIESLS